MQDNLEPIRHQEYPDGMTKSPVRLYGISGWFNHRINEEQRASISFGGYFKLGEEDRAILLGEMIDFYGSSILKGSMPNENTLHLFKQYDDDVGKEGAEYLFKKQSSGIWIGNWERTENRTRGGEAKALVTLIEKDGFDVTTQSPRQW